MTEIILYAAIGIAVYKIGKWATIKTLNKLFGKRAMNQQTKPTGEKHG